MTDIEWSDESWNPIRARLRSDPAVIGWHCEHASPGCEHCYSETRNRSGRCNMGTKLPYKPGHRKDIEVFLDEAQLVKPLSWRKGKKIFVCSMTDLFAAFVTDEMLDRIFAVMALCPQHTFQVLTKRADRMRDYMSKVWGDHEAQIARTTAAVNDVFRAAGHRGNWGYCGSTSTAITTIGSGTGAREYGMLRRRADGGVERFYWDRGEETWFRCSDAFAERLPVWRAHRSEFGWGLKQWPLPNVWLGVSVEDQQRADERIPDLLDTPAVVRWISAEPLLGPINIIDAMWARDGFSNIHATIDLVVCGGESGAKARPMHPNWARNLRDQCADSGTAFFFKQWGEWITAKGQPGHLPIGHVFEDGYQMIRVRKKLAGRLLDGVEHNGMPGNV